MKKMILIIVIGLLVFGGGVFIGNNIETVTVYDGQIVDVR